MRPILSPVLVLDALGMSSKIDKCRNPDSLMDLVTELDEQYHGFRSKVPHKLIMVGRKRVFGTRDFTTLRLNDMFILYSKKRVKNQPGKYLIAGSLLYHQLLLNGFIARGGLGFGPVVHRRDLFLGRGFLDAYRMSEKRSRVVQEVCGILVSPSLYTFISWSEHWCRLLCFYEDHCFLHPTALTDPDLGEFDEDRILRCLTKAGATRDKITATKRFMERLEDYDAALLAGSRSRYLTGWKPKKERTEASPTIEVDGPMSFDDWPSVWAEVARVRNTTYIPSERNS